MSKNIEKTNPTKNMPERYEIRIQGILDSKWLEWFECQQIIHTVHETILFCELQDQAALHGLLAKIRDMNLKLVSVSRIESVLTDKEKPNDYD